MILLQQLNNRNQIHTHTYTYTYICLKTNIHTVKLH